MNVRFKPAVQKDGQVQLVLPEGRHLEQSGWYVAADTYSDAKRVLALRVWAPLAGGFRVIVLDGAGASVGSVLEHRYEDAERHLRLSGDRGHTKPEGRRLITGGHTDWEIAAEVHFVGEEEILFLRVWCQAKQLFLVFAIDADGLVRSQTVSPVYKRAAETLRQHLVA